MKSFGAPALSFLRDAGAVIMRLVRLGSVYLRVGESVPTNLLHVSHHATDALRMHYAKILQDTRSGICQGTF